jgi:hypothetical protein
VGVKTYIFWDVTLFSPLKVNRLLEQYVFSRFKVEEQAKLETSVKKVAVRARNLRKRWIVL